MESVTSQTYPVHEILVIDDGSTDDTKNVVQEFIRAHIESGISVRYISQEQRGAAAARNSGIHAASGEWIAFLDSDDCWLPEKLTWQVQALTRFSSSSSACVTDASYTNNPQLTKTAFQQAQTACTDIIGIWDQIGKRVAYGYHGLYLQALLVRTQTVREVGEFDSSFLLNEDADFLFRLVARTSVCYVNLPLVEIDRTPVRAVGLIELSRNEKFRLELNQRLYEKWLSSPPSHDPEIRKRILLRLQEVQAGWSSWYLLNHQNDRARQTSLRALRYRLTLKGTLRWLLTCVAPSIGRKMLIKKRTLDSAELFF
jgi:glycosyltransferase involved in cell wall biosynthesis